jgi:hypothetical protein
MSSRGVYSVSDRHSCESRNPEYLVPGRLDARLRGHDGKNTPTPQLDKTFFMEELMEAKIVQPIFIQPEGGKLLNVLGEMITCEVSSEDTNGSFSFIEEISPPGGGPSPHIHYKTDNKLLNESQTLTLRQRHLRSIHHICIRNQNLYQRPTHLQGRQ